MNPKIKGFIVLIYTIAVACTIASGKIDEKASGNGTTSSTKSNLQDSYGKTSFKSETQVFDTGGRNLSCNDLIILLIKKSSFDPELKKLNFKVWIDHVENGIMSIELTLKNKERNDDVPLSWINLDKNKMELLDITVDIDNPKKLRYDSTLFKKIIKNCMR
jgi:hypothetical protein